MRSKILTLGVLRKLVSSVSTLSMYNFFRWWLKLTNFSTLASWQASTWLLKYSIAYLVYLLLVARCTPHALQIYCWIWKFFRRYVARSCFNQSPISRSAVCGRVCAIGLWLEQAHSKSGELSTSSDGYRPSNLSRFYFHLAICVDRRCPFLEIRHLTARYPARVPYSCDSTIVSPSCVRGASKRLAS